MTLHSIIAAAIPDRSKGWIDYYRFPERRASWGGPFNGQSGRQAIFDAIINLQKPTLLIETGTYLGTTTEMLAATGATVVTIEGRQRNYGFARARLRRFRNVQVRLGDSRQQLRKFFAKVGRRQKEGALFAYLDAHWNADLPLREEIELVFSWDPGAIIMIDDFQVPGDDAYGFDDYGESNVLALSYVETARRTFGLTALFPTLSSREENGARRGCVVLASEQMWAEQLLATGILKQ